MTTDASVARQLRKWFDERMHSPVTPAWLSHCRKIYRPPRGSVGRGKTQRNLTKGVWLLGTSPTNYPKSEKQVFDSGEKMASTRLRNSRNFSIESVRWTGNSAFQRGDLAVQIRKNGKTQEVYPHARLLNIKQIKTSRTTSAAYLYLETPKRYKTVRWRRFKDECRKIGLRLGRRIGTRQIRNPIQANRTLSVVSPEKLGTFR